MAHYAYLTIQTIHVTLATLTIHDIRAFLNQPTYFSDGGHAYNQCGEG